MRIEVESVGEGRPFIVEFDVESVTMSKAGDVTIEGADASRRRNVVLVIDSEEWEELLGDVES